MKLARALRIAPWNSAGFLLVCMIVLFSWASSKLPQTSASGFEPRMRRQVVAWRR